jgi:hypothetical protein
MSGVFGLSAADDDSDDDNNNNNNNNNCYPQSTAATAATSAAAVSAPAAPAAPAPAATNNAKTTTRKSVFSKMKKKHGIGAKLAAVPAVSRLGNNSNSNSSSSSSNVNAKPTTSGPESPLVAMAAAAHAATTTTTTTPTLSAPSQNTKQPMHKTWSSPFCSHWTITRTWRVRSSSECQQR